MAAAALEEAVLDVELVLRLRDLLPPPLPVAPTELRADLAARPVLRPLEAPLLDALAAACLSLE